MKLPKRSKYKKKNNKTKKVRLLPINKIIRNFINFFKVKFKKISSNIKTIKPKKTGYIQKKLVCILLVLSFIFSTFTFIFFLERKLSLPPINYDAIKTGKNTVVLDKNDNEVSDLSDSSLVMIENYKNIAQAQIDAFVSAEDARFFTHTGIDGPRTLKAFLSTYIFKGKESGGSTLTQQLVKQTILANKIAQDPHYKYSEKRKIDEWIASFLIEQHVPKSDIITSYMNSAVMYGRYTGTATAAKVFFDKEISQLTLPEAALLAGIPQLPRKNNPFYDIKGATIRYHEVLDMMKLHNFITDCELVSLKNIPLSDLIKKNKKDNSSNENLGYFKAIESELKEIFKDTALGNESAPFYYKNYKIYTSLDKEQQKLANDIMNTEKYVNWTNAAINNYGNNLTDDENNNFQGCFTVVNIENGEIPAIGISRNIKDIGLNIAYDGYRSPGSAIKPIIDYAPLVDKYMWGANHLITDKTTYYSNTQLEVFNYNMTPCIGTTNLKKAIADSINTTAVQSMQITGLKECAYLATKMGISKAYPLFEKNELPEAASLGGGIECTTKELAASYAVLANGGTYNDPHIIRKIEDVKTGEVIWQHDNIKSSFRVIKESTAATMTEALLYSAKYGTIASPARKQVNSNISFAGKTGTSSYSEEEIKNFEVDKYSEKDHWHVGYTPEYSIAVWTGLAKEGEDVLRKTQGNSSNNKAVGSYIMANWLNEFASRKKKFNFLNKANEDSKIGIGEFKVRANNNKKLLTWDIPKINYPPNLNKVGKDNLGELIYEVTFVLDNKIYNFTTKNNKIDYPTLASNFKIGNARVKAKFDKEDTNNIICSNQQYVSGIKDIRFS